MKKLPPKHLGAESKKLWRELVTEYKIDDPAGLAILKSALEARDRAEECRKSIEKQGAVFKDRFNSPKQHPLLSVERDARSAFLAGLKALNLDIEPLHDRPGRPPGGK
jgi:P27 family predicted phage terminase small subunit